MKLIKKLLEAEDGSKKKKDKPKVVFVETDPQEAFPDDTMSALKKSINKNAKDLEKEWKGPTNLVDSTFEELNVPKPSAHLKLRWQQYLKLLGIAVRDLRDSRGMKASWSNYY